MPELSRVWATEGKYLRKNLILALIEGIGHEQPTADVENLLQHVAGDMGTDEVKEVRKSMEGLNLADEDDEDDTLYKN